MFPDIVLSFFGLHAQQSFLNPTRYVSFVFIFIYAIGGLFAAWLGPLLFQRTGRRYNRLSSAKTAAPLADHAV